MCDLKTAFFRFCRWAGKSAPPADRRKNRLPVWKSYFAGVSPTPIPWEERGKVFSRNISRRRVQKTICFPIHFWTGKKGSIDRRKSPVFVQEIRMPLSRTLPLYSSSFTYSIRSAGWQSKREQITSSVPHDGICPLLIFWSIASPIIFSLRMRVVL